MRRCGMGEYVGHQRGDAGLVADRRKLAGRAPDEAEARLWVTYHRSLRPAPSRPPGRLRPERGVSLPGCSVNSRWGTAGGIVILLLVLVSIFADSLAPYRFEEIHLRDRLQAPSAATAPTPRPRRADTPQS